ncbi:MAG: lipoyl synthase [Marinifilaceae bacterium]|jgi:lipoic acid synthetase|nr:lipoyl synthase [Marinifilaceae bacterium]
MKTRRKPDWLKMQLPKNDDYVYMNNLVSKHGLHTICSSGKCPNIGECWGNKTATFMILGNICTRACKFCNVATGKPLPVDKNEPIKLARSIKIMGLKHAVITSVDRDDLEDKGASFWAEAINTVKKENPNTSLEVLIPDFDAKAELIQKVIDAKPEVISHNMETSRRLTPDVRSRAKYDLSLKVLKQIADAGIVAKSGIMLGLGETREEILEVMDDLLAVGVKVMTIGQYLQPTTKHLPVLEYVTPEQFKEYEKIGLEKGFSFVESTPLVRSSYHAEKHINALKIKKDA